eukprot:CAMPEP_0176232144 /NCGR_PEP_ID=MMETSP0121_2-20121125/25161_1 /TAXON_ID=160619 /ORGANISM="Kryptoperidinium foliaceum, Strain CCMP 1326" /LENGTH=314 /DNA_ID=CAMNT_0017571505 /DNA_START=57 /DNA_END=1001 /DNA_ORIENTATION=+
MTDAARGLLPGSTGDAQEGGKAYSGCGCCCSCVPAGSVGVVQQFGDYVGYQEPGIMFYCWPVQEIRRISLAVRQIECTTECKTKDNVTLTVTTAVQYRVNKFRLKHAVFDIVDPPAQIRAAVDNVVRSSVPALDLDDAYSNKDTLCCDILQFVKDAMDTYGYAVINVLVTDLAPERSVLQAMNAINAARRQREAAIEQGEAQKVLQVKAAEADAEAKHLSGVGMARMRVAMAQGFKDSMAQISEGGLSPQEAMHMMITTQYLDTLKDFASNPSHSAIMVPHGPGAVKDLEQQVRDGFIAAALVSKPAQQTMQGS